MNSRAIFAYLLLHISSPRFLSKKRAQPQETSWHGAQASPGPGPEPRGAPSPGPGVLGLGARGRDGVIARPSLPLFMVLVELQISARLLASPGPRASALLQVDSCVNLKMDSARPWLQFAPPWMIVFYQSRWLAMACRGLAMSDAQTWATRTHAVKHLARSPSPRLALALPGGRNEAEHGRLRAWTAPPRSPPS